EWTARGVAQPHGQAVLLLLVGLGLASYGLYTLDSSLEQDLLDSDMRIEAMGGTVNLGPMSEHAPTGTGRLIPLFRPAQSTAEAMASFPEQEFLHKRKLDQHLIQTGPVDASYNCHGWVFAGGKFWVRGAAVPDILKDNGYFTVARPQPGDIAVF